MSKDFRRVEIILEKISYIEAIVNDFNGRIFLALEDKQTNRPAILMHLVAIAEQFDKLKKENSNILKKFSKDDIKGIYDIRTFIAHDYDGVNLAIIETAIRYGLPVVEKTCSDIITGELK